MGKPSLPEDATKVTVPKYCEITSLKTRDSAELPKLILITVAPFVAAYSTPMATVLREPDPLLCNTFTGRIFASGATPETPMELLFKAATIPATCVPCMLSSRASESLFIKSKPDKTCPDKSG